MAIAVGVMAVVHGTYDTVCTLGVTAALVMEALSFALLIWAVRWVSVDATEPPGQQPTPWAATLAKPWPVRIAVAAAGLLLVAAMALGSSRDEVMPAIMSARLPEAARPYIDGVTLERADDGKALAIPLTVRFLINVERQEIVGRFTNRGTADLAKVVVTCHAVDHRQVVDEDAGKEIALGDISAGKSVEIDDDHGWTFAPGEQVTIRAEGYPAQRLTLP